MKLTGNTILITGGGTGIGLSMAASFLAKGNQVLICGRRQEKLDEAVRAHPGLRARCCDVSDAGDRQRLFDAVENDGFAVNVLVNNAAVMRTYDLADGNGLPTDQVRADVLTNFVAPVEMVDLFLPALRERAGATIINVSTPGGVVPVTRVPIYCACKAALHSYTCSLRYQLGGSVQVIEVYPPSVETAMMTRVQLPKISTEKFTEALMLQLAKGKEEIWIGEARYVPLMHRLAPNKTLRFINRSTVIS